MKLKFCFQIVFQVCQQPAYKWPLTDGLPAHVRSNAGRCYRKKDWYVFVNRLAVIYTVLRVSIPLVVLWRWEMGRLAPPSGHDSVQPHAHSGSRQTHHFNHGGHIRYVNIHEQKLCHVVNVYFTPVANVLLQRLKVWWTRHISVTSWLRWVLVYSPRKARRWSSSAPTTGVNKTYSWSKTCTC